MLYSGRASIKTLTVRKAWSHMMHLVMSCAGRTSAAQVEYVANNPRYRRRLTGRKVNTICRIFMVSNTLQPVSFDARATVRITHKKYRVPTTFVSMEHTMGSSLFTILKHHRRQTQRCRASARGVGRRLPCHSNHNGISDDLTSPNHGCVCRQLQE